jgi:hypothetical protein
MLQHEELLETAGRWGLDEEVGNSLIFGGVHSARRRLDSWRWLGGVLQLRRKMKSVRQWFEKELGEEAIGERSSPV